MIHKESIHKYFTPSRRDDDSVLEITWQGTERNLRQSSWESESGRCNWDFFSSAMTQGQIPTIPNLTLTGENQLRLFNKLIRTNFDKPSRNEAFHGTFA